MEKIFAALTTIPILTLLTLYSYILRARLLLGYWPVPEHPPYPVGSRLHEYAIIFGAGAFMPAALLCAVILLLWLLLRDRKTLFSPFVARWIVIFFIVWIGSLLLLRYDPGNFLFWVWD